MPNQGLATRLSRSQLRQIYSTDLHFRIRAHLASSRSFGQRLSSKVGHKKKTRANKKRDKSTKEDKSNNKDHTTPHHDIRQQFEQAHEQGGLSLHLAPCRIVGARPQRKVPPIYDVCQEGPRLWKRSATQHRDQQMIWCVRTVVGRPVLVPTARTIGRIIIIQKLAGKTESKQTITVMFCISS